MKIDQQSEHFLRSIAEIASPYSSVVVDEKLVALWHPFWSFDQITKGREIQAEWNVPSDLVPFYGDWHTLICLSLSARHVLLLDDDRNAHGLWQSTEEFLNGLTHSAERKGVTQPEHKAIESESWLDF